MFQLYSKRHRVRRLISICLSLFLYVVMLPAVHHLPQ